MPLRNWSENIRFESGPLHAPESVEALQEVVRASQKVRVLGARHSFNDAAAIDAQADVDGTQKVARNDSWAYISLENLDAAVEFDHERGTVTCSGGITYGALCTIMHANGVALHNTASLPHITVAGACATGTHGSGDGNGNLATAVVGLELVTADGELKSLTLDEDREVFEGSVVALGGLGIVTRMTLAAQPAFAMQQYVYEDLASSALYANFDEIMSSAYSVSLFPDWQEDKVNQVWFKHNTGSWARPGDGRAGRPVEVDLGLPSEIHGATAAITDLHPVPGFPTDGLTVQMGVPGAWHDRLHHFEIESTPASGDELQTEYFVPRRHAVPALQAVEGLRERFRGMLWISEIRSVAADQLWLSQSYGTPTIGIHFSWRKNWPVVREVLPIVEEALAPFEVRPHWGKLFTVPPEMVQAAYPRMDDFKKLQTSMDPEGKFRNGYLDRFVFS